MMLSPTVEQLRAVKAKMLENQIPPRVIKTQREAARANALDRSLGLKGSWRVGDEYYLCSDGRFF